MDAGGVWQFMLCFIDESGDPGIRDVDGSSSHFLVTTTHFPTMESAQACEAAVAALRATMRLSPYKMFRFSHESDDVRREFLRAVSPHDFVYSVAVVDKAELQRNGLSSSHGGDLYKDTVCRSLHGTRELIRNAKVVLDVYGGGSFEAELVNHLRTESRTWTPDGECCVRKFTFQSAKKNTLVQLSDMIGGAVMRFVANGSNGFRSLVQGRELGITTWPESESACDVPSIQISA